MYCLIQQRFLWKWSYPWGFIHPVAKPLQEESELDAVFETMNGTRCSGTSHLALHFRFV